MSIEPAKQAALNTNTKAILEKRAKKEQKIRAHKEEKKIRALARINKAIDRNKQRGNYYVKVSTSYRRYMRHYEDAGYRTKNSPGLFGGSIIISWIPPLNAASAKESPELANYIKKLKAELSVGSYAESSTDSSEESTDETRNAASVCANCGDEAKHTLPYSHRLKVGPICPRCDPHAFGEYTPL